MLKQALESVQGEKKSAEHRISTASEENERLPKELHEAVTRAESNAMLIVSLEQKLKQLLVEKQDYETIIMKLYSTVASSEAQKMIRELLTTQKDLHTALRDKLANEQILARKTTELEIVQENTENYRAAKRGVLRLEKIGTQLMPQIGI